MADAGSHRSVGSGELLAGRYRVERVLGEGGMGVVVAARHVELGQRVALKFMLPHREASPGSRERFLQEARAAVRLRSQHVAKVLDVGTLKREADGDESPFIVMEYLDGCDLDQVLETRWPIPIEDAVEYLLHACEAVGEAHALGIVHRDLKPANLFLTKNADGSPCVKVLDFGLSKLTSAAALQKPLTKTNTALGTPHYMAPEQMRSARNVDLRADIWALGAIAYELLTRQVPFDAETVTELCARVLEEDASPPSMLRPELPPALDKAVLKCLVRDPSARWQSIAELADALAPFAPPRASLYGERVANVMAEASSGGDQARGDEAGRGKLPGSVTGAAWHKGRPARASRGVDLRVIGAAAAVTSVAVLVGFMIGRGGEAVQPAATPPTGERASDVESPAESSTGTSPTVPSGRSDVGPDSQSVAVSPVASSAEPSAVAPPTSRVRSAGTSPISGIPTAAAGTPSAAGSKCADVFYYDPNSTITKYKRECQQ